MSNRSYNPTNYRFTDHTKRLVGTKTKKGHLEEKKKKDTSTEKGILVRIVRLKVYSDGWEVKVGKDKDAKVYKCYYGDNMVYLPDSKTTELYYIPKNECEVILTVDEKSGHHMIKRINDPKKKPITFYENQLILQGDGTQQVVISDTETSISSDTNVDGDITSKGDIKSEGDVIVKTEEGEDDISLKEIYKEIQNIKITVDEMSSDSDE